MKYLLLLLLPTFFYVKIAFENRKVRIAGNKWRATHWQSPSRWIGGGHRNVGECAAGKW